MADSRTLDCHIRFRSLSSNESLSLSHSLSHSLFHTHTLKHTLAHTHTHTLSLTLAILALSPCLSLSVSLSLYIYLPASLLPNPIAGILNYCTSAKTRRDLQSLNFCKTRISAKQVGEEIFSSDDGFYS